MISQIANFVADKVQGVSQLTHPTQLVENALIRTTFIPADLRELLQEMKSLSLSDQEAAHLLKGKFEQAVPNRNCLRRGQLQAIEGFQADPTPEKRRFAIGALEAALNSYNAPLEKAVSSLAAALMQKPQPILYHLKAALGTSRSVEEIALIKRDAQNAYPDLLDWRLDGEELAIELERAIFNREGALAQLIHRMTDEIQGSLRIVAERINKAAPLSIRQLTQALAAAQSTLSRSPLIRADVVKAMDGVVEKMRGVQEELPWSLTQLVGEWERYKEEDQATQIAIIPHLASDLLKKVSRSYLETYALEEMLGSGIVAGALRQIQPALDGAFGTIQRQIDELKRLGAAGAEWVGMTPSGDEEGISSAMIVYSGLLYIYRVKGHWSGAEIARLLLRLQKKHPGLLQEILSRETEPNAEVALRVFNEEIRRVKQRILLEEGQKRGSKEPLARMTPVSGEEEELSIVSSKELDRILNQRKDFGVEAGQESVHGTFQWVMRRIGLGGLEDSGMRLLVRVLIAGADKLEQYAGARNEEENAYGDIVEKIQLMKTAYHSLIEKETISVEEIKKIYNHFIEETQENQLIVYGMHLTSIGEKEGGAQGLGLDEVVKGLEREFKLAKNKRLAPTPLTDYTIELNESKIQLSETISFYSVCRYFNLDEASSKSLVQALQSEGNRVEAFQRKLSEAIDGQDLAWAQKILYKVGARVVHQIVFFYISQFLEGVTQFGQELISAFSYKESDPLNGKFVSDIDTFLSNIVDANQEWVKGSGNGSKQEFIERWQEKRLGGIQQMYAKATQVGIDRFLRPLDLLTNPLRELNARVNGWMITPACKGETGVGWALNHVVSVIKHLIGWVVIKPCFAVGGGIATQLQRGFDWYTRKLLMKKAEELRIIENAIKNLTAGISEPDSKKAFDDAILEQLKKIKADLATDEEKKQGPLNHYESDPRLSAVMEGVIQNFSLLVEYSNKMTKDELREYMETPSNLAKKIFRLFAEPKINASLIQAILTASKTILQEGELKGRLCHLLKAADLSVIKSNAPLPPLVASSGGSTQEQIRGAANALIWTVVNRAIDASWEDSKVALERYVYNLTQGALDELTAKRGRESISRIEAWTDLVSSYEGLTIPKRIERLKTFSDDLIDFFREWAGRMDLIRTTDSLGSPTKNEVMGRFNKINSLLAPSKHSSMEESRLSIRETPSSSDEGSMEEEPTLRASYHALREIEDERAVYFEILTPLEFVLNAINCTMKKLNENQEGDFNINDQLNLSLEQVEALQKKKPDFNALITKPGNPLFGLGGLIDSLKGSLDRIKEEYQRFAILEKSLGSCLKLQDKWNETNSFAQLRKTEVEQSGSNRLSGAISKIKGYDAAFKQLLSDLNQGELKDLTPSERSSFEERINEFRKSSTPEQIAKAQSNLVEHTTKWIKGLTEAAEESRKIITQLAGESADKLAKEHAACKERSAALDLSVQGAVEAFKEIVSRLKTASEEVELPKFLVAGGIPIPRNIQNYATQGVVKLVRPWLGQVLLFLDGSLVKYAANELVAGFVRNEGKIPWRKREE